MLQIKVVWYIVLDKRGFEAFQHLRRRMFENNDAGAHVQQSSQVITAVETLEMPT